MRCARRRAARLELVDGVRGTALAGAALPGWLGEWLTDGPGAHTTSDSFVDVCVCLWPGSTKPCSRGSAWHGCIRASMDASNRGRAVVRGSMDAPQGRWCTCSTIGIGAALGCTASDTSHPLQWHPWPRVRAECARPAVSCHGEQHQRCRRLAWRRWQRRRRRRRRPLPQRWRRSHLHVRRTDRARVPTTRALWLQRRTRQPEASGGNRGVWRDQTPVSLPPCLPPPHHASPLPPRASTHCHSLASCDARLLHAHLMRSLSCVRRACPAT